MHNVTAEVSWPPHEPFQHSPFATYLSNSGMTFSVPTSSSTYNCQHSWTIRLNGPFSEYGKGSKSQLGLLELQEDYQKPCSSAGRPKHSPTIISGRVQTPGIISNSTAANVRGDERHRLYCATRPNPPAPHTEILLLCNRISAGAPRKERHLATHFKKKHIGIPWSVRLVDDHPSSQPVTNCRSLVARKRICKWVLTAGSLESEIISAVPAVQPFPGPAASSKPSPSRTKIFC